MNHYQLSLCLYYIKLKFIVKYKTCRLQKPSASFYIYIKFYIQFSLHLFDNLHNFFNAWHVAACYNFAVDNKRR